jgi:hypothetical protein
MRVVPFTFWLLVSNKNSPFPQTANDYKTEEVWFDYWQGQEIFFFSRTSRPVLRPTQPPIQ